MLININNNQIDNRDNEEIYDDYIKKREKSIFLSRVIIVNDEPTVTINESYKVSDYNSNIKTKKKLKKNYKLDLFNISSLHLDV
jgi:hypothetical protein